MPRLRRRFLQYGLRSLLLLTLAAAVFFGWIAHEKRKYARQQSALERFAQLGAVYTSSPQSPRWLGWFVGKDFVKVDELAFGRPSGLGFLYVQVTSEEYANLSDILAIGKLTIYSDQFDDDACAHIRHFRSLHSLELRSERLTDSAIATLADLHVLEKLSLHSTAATPAVLVELSRSPSLRQVELSFGKNADNPIEVSAFARLETLSLYDMQEVSFYHVPKNSIMAGGLSLQGLPALRELQLDATVEGSLRLNDLPVLEKCRLQGSAADAAIENCPSLKTLAVHLGMSRSERTVVTLKGVPSLEQLDARGACVSCAAAGELRSLQELLAIEAEFVNMKDCIPQSLEQVSLFSSALASDDFAALLQSPALCRLFVYRTPIDTALFANCRGLEELILRSLEIKDADLENVAHLSDLRKLELSDTPKIYGSGLEHLAALSHLEELKIESNQQLNDSVLPHLLKLQNLESLHLGDDIVSTAVSLRDGLPRLQFIHCGAMYQTRSPEGWTQDNAKRPSNRSALQKGGY